MDPKIIADVWQAFSTLSDVQVATPEVAALITTFSPYGGPDDPES